MWPGITTVPHITYAVLMPRKTETDATGNLKPEDERQDAPGGTKIGRLSRSKVLADFRKIARAKKD